MTRLAALLVLVVASSHTASAAALETLAVESEFVLKRLDDARPIRLVYKTVAVAVDAARTPASFTVKATLDPVVTPPHPWTRHTCYFENGALTNSLRGMNTDFGCTIDAETLSAGDALVVVAVRATDLVQEECAEWAQNRGGDDYCVRGTGTYRPTSTWSFRIAHPRVKGFHCVKRSPERSLNDPIEATDRLSREDLKTIFGALIAVN